MNNDYDKDNQLVFSASSSKLIESHKQRNCLLRLASLHSLQTGSKKKKFARFARKLASLFFSLHNQKRHHAYHVIDHSTTMK